ncbi:ethanolamine ammonia-lyase reactivating factor EutA [Pluralibacter gergoviae]|uniref:Ethanolamine ammonia-lyase reactivase n=1 Tax=Pluralibacter gergoviae TaxID=61647 RepID=A0AAI9DGU8_PLUGE|nr:ethanolamine ammonia-lyase reactivating factor EutA [Pluralibacter gergoviae]AIR00558.1 reactivating factor for ethanolamine ammonia lyase [Pluralibacter gergoviae]AVR05246.1 ethanolamine ammonia-lyase reactivating factor EutA [Pluralibacter gergoviae]EKV0913644.1 ethanolamine ammonia-lyase reactivating factor EutA [Pluralibacter gergoviae]EKV9909151.1 ethanolamine ammonia-lyase reactivating factor EutA [Pluralibacter gergoviae]EKW6617505.1 ethanolamine ammonia-lyase reactivating factor Eut
MKTLELLSVGIDVGTTTTQVIFSRLALVNRAAVSQVPRYEFVERKIIWQSPVLFTPVDKDGHLREEELLALVLAQYRDAGIEPASIDSGAIIITGETAKTRNARPAVMALSQQLGDFVVATAGPHLESVIAGFGSGAQSLSAQTLGRVLNVDIGGGTANYALFDAGQVAGSACLNVGGRLFETDGQGRVSYVHAPGRLIARDCFGEQVDPMSLTPAQLNTVAERMSGLLYEVIDGHLSPLGRALLMTDPLPAPGTCYAVTLSGGVGECYSHPQPGGDFSFGDIGPLLAQAIRRNPQFSALPMRTPAQTVRATVIGAGAHTLSLSGSTIWLDRISLPVRNIPVVHPALGGSREDDLVSTWRRALTQMDLHPERDLYALALPESLPTSYASVQRCIDALAQFSQAHPNPLPLLVIASQDFGKALGMLLRPLMAGRELAVIDEVITHTGDYIDIGTPLFGGAVVPVTVKSLAFPS